MSCRHSNQQLIYLKCIIIYYTHIMKSFLFLILFTSSVHLIHAQSIRGIIIDTDKQGILSVTIRLFNEDSVFVKGTVTDINGSYAINNISAGEFPALLLDIFLNMCI